ncbi:MAG: hypothetical protein CO094_13445 [Anaerolineae bacterium CG_4_9_14_3_um_filter_57_17]|nr:hypothetical protein [bacterium]NCT20113.1 hypothetical protein [bacterium]OIO87002.1 MAG: hypothetical protein AUK01_01455 [Anaerolineae bacterium CG2_30_57_67]PJB64370.1 MAG: hypothetical protein CO094_13445 [Anaerolineae bacterium CG_4_9_14_3_um_filter_57_17]
MKSPLGWLFPSFKNLFFALILAGVMARGNTLLNADGDLGHHLALGRLMLTSGQIPQTDPFSFRTAGVAAVPHEWLVEIIFAALEKAFGLGGIVFFSALLIAAALTVTFVESARRSDLLIAALTVSALTLGATALHWITRPHLATFLMLAIWTAQLEAFALGEHRRWWVFPALMLLWANLHGMFILGLLGLAFVILGYLWERWLEKKTGDLGRGFALAAIFSTLATFLTPSGAELWTTIFRLAASPAISALTSEYRPADFHQPGTWPFLILLGIALASAVLSGKKFSMRAALALSGWTLMALYSARNIPLAAIALAPLISELLAGWILTSPALIALTGFSRRLEAVERRLRGWLWAALVTLVLFWLTAQGASLDPQGRAYQFDPQKFPAAAVTWLQTHPQSGQMVNEFDWGGYLLLRAWPQYKIFMDGHTHIYGEAKTLEYAAVISTEPGWQEILTRYDIRWAILKPNTPLAAALESSGWQTDYRDETAVILTKP